VGNLDELPLKTTVTLLVPLSPVGVAESLLSADNTVARVTGMGCGCSLLLSKFDKINIFKIAI
jgi:hypothetical protein